MLNPVFTSRFERDVKRANKRGKDMEKFKTIVSLLLNKQFLPDKNKDHVLVGHYVGRRECHIEPDWLLIYKVTADSVIFERMGSHADLFR